MKLKANMKIQTLCELNLFLRLRAQILLQSRPQQKSRSNLSLMPRSDIDAHFHYSRVKKYCCTKGRKKLTQ